MIIEYYKGYINIENLRDILKIDKNGTTAYHIVEGAKKIGFEAKGVKCDLDEINEDNIVLPCIANVVINSTYKHFVVIYKIDFLNNYLIIADPANKIIKMPFDIFKSIFSGILILLYPNSEIPKEEKLKLKLVILKKIIKSHPNLLKQIFFLSVFITTSSLISSYLLEWLSLIISKYKSSSIIILLALFFMIITFIKELSALFRDRLLILVNEKLNLILTLDTFEKIISLPYKSYCKKTTGDMIVRLLDIESIKNNISEIFITLIVDLPLALVAVVFLITINFNLTIISLIIIILYFLVILLFRDYFNDKIKILKKKSSNITNIIIESIKNYETLKGIKVSNYIKNYFEKCYVDFLGTVYNYDNIFCIQRFLKNLINNIGIIIIYLVGSILVVQEKLTFGNLLTFSSILMYFFDPIKNLINLEKSSRELDISLKRIQELDSLQSKESGICNNIIRGNIEYRNLSFTYNDRKEILKNINLKIESGKKVIIIGPSGSGKSTLMKLLMKYYDTSRGQLLVNNIDINDYSEINGINYVSQNENLFTDSLINNLTLYEEYPINKILEVSNICCLNEIINSDSLGYNMFIEENGFNLSGGERQKIILARTLMKKFNVLIIDEGTNQIDIESERKILNNIFSKFKDKTIIVISHRLDNSDLFDKVIKMNLGEVIEQV